jgi:DNA-binding CsgD family transcriptional regulator
MVGVQPRASMIGVQPGRGIMIREAHLIVKNVPAELGELPDGDLGNHDVVPISALKVGNSPRLSGTSESHVRRLAECDTHLPPIVVHRRTMRIIDGMHRLRAAERKGQTKVEITYFDGNENEAFILAVELNIRHGLPLLLSDRKAAAARILAADPNLSDRWIASKTGISDKTVGALRKRSGAENPHPNVRRGRDGRIYPMAASELRGRIARLISERPSASLREIASIAGASPSTVCDVRKRLSGKTASDSESEAWLERKPGSIKIEHDASSPPCSSGPCSAGGQTTEIENREAILARLRSDPSVRSREGGRKLLRWLSSYTISTGDLPEVANAIPSHQAELVVSLARDAAGTWLELARKVEKAGRVRIEPATHRALRTSLASSS